MPTDVVYPHPLIITVILNTNRREDTLACLASLGESTYPNQRVIVLDNASSDGSVEAIRSQFPAVEMIQLKQNLGYAGNNNIGIEAALQQGADWIFVLNEDTIVAPDCMDQLMETAARKESTFDARVGILGPKVYHANEPDLIQSAGGKLTDRWTAIHIGQNENDLGQYDDERQVDWISGCALLVKSQVIQECGALDPRFFYYWEETDWCKRATEHGWQIWYVPEAKIWHKGVQKDYAPSPNVTYYNTRNRLLFMAKHHAPLTVWISVLGRFMLTLTSWSLRPKWREMRPHRDAMRQGITDFFARRWGMRPDVIARNETTPDVIARNEATPDVVARNEAIPDVVARREATPDVIARNEAIPADAIASSKAIPDGVAPHLMLCVLTEAVSAGGGVGSRPSETGSSASNKIETLLFNEIQQSYPADRPRRVNIDLDLACLIYTSGSTGEPKGVMSDHSNVVFAATSITEYLQNIEDDIVIDVLPLSFDYGLYQLLMVFKFGGTLVLERSFAYPAAVLQRMQEERVTGFPGVPTIFSMILQIDLTLYDLSALRYISNTAAALPSSHIQRLREKFAGVTLFSMYGLTETKRTLYLPPEYLDSKSDSVGIPIPGTEVWVEDEAGRRLPPGEVGELVARGRHVMRGYWEDPLTTAMRFRPGPIPGERLCYTGDLFRMDEDGFLYFVGRKDDIIKTRGEKVAPKEVENVLYRMEGVSEAAVVGISDPVLGQAIKAVVVVRDPNIRPVDILAHCRANLEDFMTPKWVEIVSELPKTPSGKIDKKLLV